MNLKKILLILLSVLLVAEVGALVMLRGCADDVTMQATEPPVTDAAPTDPTVLPT